MQQSFPSIAYHLVSTSSKQNVAVLCRGCADRAQLLDDLGRDCGGLFIERVELFFVDGFVAPQQEQGAVDERRAAQGSLELHEAQAGGTGRACARPPITSPPFRISNSRLLECSTTRSETL